MEVRGWSERAREGRFENGFKVFGSSNSKYGVKLVEMGRFCGVVSLGGKSRSLVWGTLSVRRWG